MSLIRRLWNVFRRRSLNEELRQELETHVALLEEEARANGLTAAHARRHAQLRFGPARIYQERALEAVMASWVEQVWQDLRHTLRGFRQRPGFTVVAVVSLALGVGINTAMFSVIDTVLVRPLPYPAPDRLVQVVPRSNTGFGVSLSIPEYDVVREHSRAFASVAGYRGGGERHLTTTQGQDWVTTTAVTTDFLRTLGVNPVMGREFTSDETRANGDRGVLLTDSVWRRSLGADPGILGRTVTLDDVAFTIVGVLPPGFWFPERTDVLVPLQPTGGLTDLGTNTRMLARLKDGLGLEQGQADLDALAGVLRSARVARSGAVSPTYRGLTAVSYHDALVGDVRVNLLLLFGATGLLLLIACGNLAMLLTSRLAARRKEIALRVALGSGASRLCAQFLIEHLALVALGTAAAIGAAYGLLQGLVAWVPFGLPGTTPPRLDAGVLGFALAVAVLTAVAFTGFAVLLTRRLDVRDALNAGGRAAGQDTHHRTRNVLAVAEVALSTTLLIAAGLLGRSLYALQQERLGFTPGGLVTFTTPLDPTRLTTPDSRRRFADTVRTKLQGVSGVRDVAITSLLPLSGRNNLPTERDGHPDQSIGAMEVRSVTSNYFEIMGIPLRRGRSLTQADSATSPPVVTIGETVARVWWPDANPIGDRLLIGAFQGRRFGNDPPREVVAVVGDTKSETLRRPPSPTIYVPLEQGMFGTASLSWIVKADHASAMAGPLRAAISDLDPRQRILAIHTMDDLVASNAAASRFNALLFAIFAAVALLLAVVGLYGVLSFLVSQRRQEIGVRLALGASRGDVVCQFLTQGLGLTTVGLGLGLAAAFPLAQWLSTLLYAVRPNDPTTFVGVAALLTVVGVAASVLPARRAASVDPLVALRTD